MAVLIASAGYEGTVNETEWAGLQASAGGRMYGVGGPGDWVVSSGTLDREVRVAPGVGFGWGVIDSSTDPEFLQLDAVASGSRWDLVVARRDWAENRTSFAVVQGSATKAIPATRETSVGTLDEQPVALVRVQSGQSRVAEIVDLRVWGGDGGSLAADPLVLQYMNRPGTVLRIGEAEWARGFAADGTLSWTSTPTGDTGYMTSDLQIAGGSGWRVTGYQMRRVAGRVLGMVNVQRTGGTITFNANADVLDDPTLATVNTPGWRPTGFSRPVTIRLIGGREFFGQAEPWGALVLTHAAMPSITITRDQTLRVYLDYAI